MFVFSYSFCLKFKLPCIHFYLSIPLAEWRYMLVKPKVALLTGLILNSRNTFQPPYEKINLEFIYAFGISFVANNNPSDFNCFYLNKNNGNGMWLLDILYFKSKQIKFSKFVKFNTVWFMNYGLKVDKFLLHTRFLCAICWSKNLE